jgi:hypothetical protein
MAASKNRRAQLFHIRDEIEAVAIAVKGLSGEQWPATSIVVRSSGPQIVAEAAKALPREDLA